MSKATILRAIPSNRWPALGGRTSMFWGETSRIKGGVDWGTMTPEDAKDLAKACRYGHPGWPVWPSTKWPIEAGTDLCFDIDRFLELDRTPVEMESIVRAAAQVMQGSGLEFTGYYWAACRPIADYVGESCLTLDQYRAERLALGNLGLIDQYYTSIGIRCTLDDEPWPYGGDYDGWNRIDVNLNSLGRWIDTVRQNDPSKKVGTWIQDNTGGSLSKDRYAQIADAIVNHVGGDLVYIWGEDTQIVPMYDACAALIRPPTRGPVRPPTRSPFVP